MPEIEFEPVTPDPKKLRRTALILGFIMIAGGFLILKAYEKMSFEAAKDNRPSFVTQISARKDLLFMRQDGERKEMLMLKGSVLVVQCLPKDQPDEVTTGVMKRLEEKFEGREDFALVTLMLDPGKAEGLKEELGNFAKDLGAELPFWTVATNERETLHKFIKNEFKANMFPYQRDGEWTYDQSLVLIDKNRHVRRAVVPQKRGGAPYVAKFDFEQAAKWDADGIKTGTGFSNVDQLERLLVETVEILLKEKVKK